MAKYLLCAIFSLSLCAAFAKPYYELADGILKIGNDKIERSFKFNDGDLRTIGVLDKSANKYWKSDGKNADFFIPASAKASGAVLESEYFDKKGAEFLRLTLSFKKGELEVRRVFEVCDAIAFVNSQIFLKGSAEGIFVPDNINKADLKNIENLKAAAVDRKLPTLDKLRLKGGVWNVKTVEFFDVTDRHYTLVKEFSDFPVRSNSYRGNLMFMRNADENAGLVFIKQAPVSGVQLAYPSADFVANGSEFEVVGLGALDSDVSQEGWTRLYACALGVFSGDEFNALKAVRDFQKNIRADKIDCDEMIMMNTWGDRGQDKKVNEKFCIAEIERGAKLGITHFQIDDGWQSGKSANSAFKGGSFKNIWANPDYWKPDPVKYPSGLAPVAKAAKSAGIELCLWFNPSSQNDFEDWQKDASAMIEMYRQYGVKVFKIDGVTVANKLGEARLRMMFDKVVQATDGKAVFNIDVTAGRRGGYFYMQEYGNLFLENRYTDWGNYYPFSTLRNLWMLSKYVPPEKIQVEFLNKWRNTDKYKGSRLAPANYSFEYIFAVAMAGQPLAWFEATGLPPEAFKIAPMIADYKKISKNFHGGTILPVGDEPFGSSWTGFQSVGKNSDGFVLIFREDNAEASHSIKLYDAKNCEIEFTPVFEGRGKPFTAKTGQGAQVVFSIPQKNDFVMYSYRKISR